MEWLEYLSIEHRFVVVVVVVDHEMPYFFFFFQKEPQTNDKWNKNWERSTRPGGKRIDKLAYTSFARIKIPVYVFSFTCHLCRRSMISKTEQV